MKLTQALFLFTASLLLQTGFLPPAGSAPLPGAVGYTVGHGGLSSLKYGGQEFLGAEGDGSIAVANPPVTALTAGGAAPNTGAVTADPARQSVRLVGPCGWVKCGYAARGDRLNLQLTVHNAASVAIKMAPVRLMQLTFPGAPECTELDAGQFGRGGVPRPLHDYPAVADPRAAPPIVFIDYGTGSLAFCSDHPSVPAVVAVSPTTSTRGASVYSFTVSPGALQRFQTVSYVLSLRFGPAHSTTLGLAGDVVRRYAKAYPFQVHWADRRSIGTLFLSSAGNHPPLNPRGWFNNADDVDVTTPEGLIRFRTRLLAYADASIKILTSMNAQGMITWDPEGQEYPQATYYGDPRLAGRLAPETDYRGGSPRSCLDEYFTKFRAAGFRVGVCVRPQEIRFVDGKPVQEDSPDPAATLKRKIAYARARWGCTLFYIDSTVDNHGNSLDASIFKRVADAFPDVLLMPENETLRYFAYSAPLNSFEHHGVTSTPPGAREVYPRAFSVLLAGFGDFAAHRAQLVSAVRRGDILLFHGWWPNPNNPIMKSIYDEAHGEPAHGEPAHAASAQANGEPAPQ